jgi:YkoY family integral membrane protein
MNEYFQHIATLWQEIADKPWQSLAIVANLIIIESLLSVDNAAVLATMVMDLPKEQREKALRYGIIGAYFFRGLALIFVAILIKIWWLKPLGGLYLLYLVYDWYKSKKTQTTEDDTLDKKSNWIYKTFISSFGTFWTTVLLVEVMDMAFSIDNVFAVVAFTPNILLICFGVFIGILAMRFVAQAFVTLMEKYSFLESAAFIVIGILGLKLLLSVVEHFIPNSDFTKIMSSHEADMGISFITVLIFVVPILTSRFLGFPKKNN